MNGGTTGSTGPLHPGDHRPEAGLPLALALAHGVAGDVLEARVLVAQADDRSDHGDLVHDAGDPGQQLADLDAGQPGRDRLELAADAVGRSGFRSKVSWCGAPPER